MRCSDDENIQPPADENAKLRASGIPVDANRWLEDHAKRVHATYANYFAALTDGDGGMRPGLASDGVHPTKEGYAIMRPVAEVAMRMAATGRARSSRL